MFFKTSLYISLLLFGAGLFYKVSTWFRYSLVREGRLYSPLERISALFEGLVRTILGRKVKRLVGSLVMDVFLQLRTLRQDFFRWLMHLLIFCGFLGLILMHALQSIISQSLFGDYASTLNPFMFLRDLFGAMVLTGVAMAMYRRFIQRFPRLRTGVADHYAILLLIIILLSGILLEGVKMTSYRAFKEMEEAYAGLEDEEEIRALESLWVEEMALVSPNVKGPFAPDLLSRGREIHEVNCAGCHSSPKWAFTGYAIARTIKPVALDLDRIHLARFLWHMHFLACFIGLAYLPLSKMFHIIASPLSLLCNAVMDRERFHPANLVTKQIMELDACTHCGACSLRCAVGMAYEEIPNVYILPSEKISSLKALAAGGLLQEKDIRVVQEGLYLCTNCHRCTEVCPAGIDLQTLWSTVRESLLQKGYAEPFILSPLSLYRGLVGRKLAEGPYHGPLRLAKQAIVTTFKVDIQNNTLSPALRDQTLRSTLRMSVQGNTFSHCYNCKTCTTACPLMHHFEHPQRDLGLVPHQIMQATALGLRDLVLSSKMLWACLGCYRCQEQCPQGVRVADLFYELKNLAMQQVKGRMAGS